MENVLIMTDVFSKYTHAVPIHDQWGSTLYKGIRQWMVLQGRTRSYPPWPRQHFESNLIQQLCSMYGTEKSHATPYQQAGNGQCEWTNHTLHNLLSNLPGTKNSDCSCYLPQVTFSYTTPQRTGESPFLLMFGQDLHLPVDFLLGREQEPVAGSTHCGTPDPAAACFWKCYQASGANSWAAKETLWPAYTWYSSAWRTAGVVDHVIDCPFSEPPKLMEAPPVDESLLDGEWFVLVPEPTPALVGCQSSVPTHTCKSVPGKSTTCYS